MKILISTDIEGVAGVYNAEQTRMGNGEYERARVWMTGEANAAIAGAFDAGATEVLVNDSHGPFRNLLADRIDPRARLVQGKPRPLGMMGGLEEKPDAVGLVGYHSRAGGRGILAHTTNGFAFAAVMLHGVEYGEAGLYGAMAGEHGVPVIFASGDDCFIAENRDLFQGATFVETKRATGHASGISLSPERSCAAIREGVAKAVAARSGVKPFVLPTPVAVRVRTRSPALADLFSTWPGIERTGGEEIAFTAATVEHAVRMVNGFSAMSSMLR